MMEEGIAAVSNRESVVSRKQGQVSSDLRMLLAMKQTLAQIGREVCYLGFGWSRYRVESEGKEVKHGCGGVASTGLAAVCHC